MLRLVDPDGNPVAGARVVPHLVMDDLHGRDATGRGDGVLSDARGMVAVPWPADGALNPEGPLPLYAWHAERDLVGLPLLPVAERAERDESVTEWRLEPACRVHGEVISSDLADRGLELGQTQVMLIWPAAPVIWTSNERRFDLRLPPGNHRLYALERSDDRYRSGRNLIELQIDPGERDKALLIDLPAHVMLRGIGLAAPELEGIRGWCGGDGPATLAGLRGRVVLLHFSGLWCPGCVKWMPRLMDLHERWGQDLVQILAIYTADYDTVELLEEALDQARREHWDGRSVPFPVALDGGQRRPDEPLSMDKSVYGAVHHAYDIYCWPTTVLIDRAGRLLGPIDIGSDHAIRMVERAIADAPCLDSPNWQCGGGDR